ncbi:MAG: tol-pal system YbgF family protein, partial [Thermodesulfobacteriota bacterium]
FDTLMESYPNNPIALEARLGKAVIFEEMGRLREAAALLNSLIEVYPNREAIKVRLSWVKKRMRERASRRK